MKVIALVIIAVFVLTAGCTDRELYGIPNKISPANTEENPVLVMFNVGQTNNIGYDIIFDDIKIGSYISSEHSALDVIGLNPFAGARIFRLNYDQLPNKTIGQHKLKFVNPDGVVEDTNLIDIV